MVTPPDDRHTHTHKTQIPAALARAIRLSPPVGSYVSTPGFGYYRSTQLETRNASMHSGVLRLVAVSWHCRRSVPGHPNRGCGLPSLRLIVSSLVSHEGPGRHPRLRLPARTGPWRSHCWAPLGASGCLTGRCHLGRPAGGQELRQGRWGGRRSWSRGLERSSQDRDPDGGVVLACFKLGASGPSDSDSTGSGRAGAGMGRLGVHGLIWVVCR